MTLSVFSAPPLSAANTTATVQILDPGVVAGIQNMSSAYPNAQFPIYGGPPNPAQPGVYIASSANANLQFRLTRHIATGGTRGFGSYQVLLTGDQSRGFPGPPIISVTNTDLVMLELFQWVAGSVTLSIVQ